jgi:hypothetical protein
MREDERVALMTGAAQESERRPRSGLHAMVCPPRNDALTLGNCERLPRQRMTHAATRSVRRVVARRSANEPLTETVRTTWVHIDGRRPPMRHPFSMRPVLAAAFALSVLAVACSNGSTAAAGGGGDTLSIAMPTDGAKVSESFTVTVDASVPLGDPSTGDDHVHLCFDGASCDSEYTLVYGDTFQVDNLAPGQHTIEASLRNADHSAVGPTDMITVTVTGGAGTTPGTPSMSSASPNPTDGNGGY